MKILESKRIILRPWQISDLDDLHGLCQMNKWQGYQALK